MERPHHPGVVVSQCPQMKLLNPAFLVVHQGKFHQHGGLELQLFLAGKFFI
jgi:hypothetical protein